MHKNILIINSDPQQDDSLFNLFAELNNQGYILRFLTNSLKQKRSVGEKLWSYAKLRFLPGKNNRINHIFFILCWPLLSLFYSAKLVWQKIKYKIKIIICFSWQEKILFTPIARLLKIKIIWLELPGVKNYPKQGFLKKIYWLNSKKAKIIILNSLTGEGLLRLKIPESNIFYTAPGIKNTSMLRQENIFSELVETRQIKKNKYFTIGTILPARGEDKTETLCQAIKNCLSVVANPQLIILDKKDKKQNLAWFIKKIGIANIVWFVGEPAFPGKWLSNFDIFVFTGNVLTLSDYMMAIRAAALSLPIIGTENIGLEDIVINGKNGYLINTGDSECLSQNIIKLQQNPHLRKRLGAAGKEIVSSNFQLGKMTERFIEILEK